MQASFIMKSTCFTNYLTSDSSLLIYLHKNRLATLKSNVVQKMLKINPVHTIIILSRTVKV